MGGTGQPPPRSHPEQPRTPGPPADAVTGAGAGQESGAPGRREACPTDFPAEVTDIPEAMQAAAAGIRAETRLPIHLHGEDPAFLHSGELLGWLAVNIEEVTECLQAGWRYHGIVRSNESSPAGPIIATQVFGVPPPAS